MGHLTDADASIRAVLKQIQDDWTDYPLVIQIDNRIVVDQGGQTEPYLDVQIEPLGGGQADMADRPLVEQYGQILLAAVVRCGAGTTDAKKLLDFVLPYFDMKDIGTVRCHAAVAVKPREEKGQYYAPGMVNYWYHRVS
jgi:hypothetical protein